MAIGVHFCLNWTTARRTVWQHAVNIFLGTLTIQKQTRKPNIHSDKSAISGRLLPLRPSRKCGQQAPPPTRGIRLPEFGATAAQNTRTKRENLGQIPGGPDVRPQFLSHTRNSFTPLKKLAEEDVEKCAEIEVQKFLDYWPKSGIDESSELLHLIKSFQISKLCKWVLSMVYQVISSAV